MLVINPATSTFTFSEVANLGEGKLYWGICAGSDGRLYCAPSDASAVLVLGQTLGADDASAREVCKRCQQAGIAHELPRIAFVECPGAGTSAYASICTGADGRLFCAPLNASTVWVVDPGTSTSVFMEGAGTGSLKYFDICEGPGGRLYCAPYHASAVLVVDPSTTALTFIEGAGAGAMKWSGICAGPDGLLYCAPLRASTVLVIDPEAPKLTFLGGPSFRHNLSRLPT